MREYKNVEGTMETVKPFEVNVTTTYVRTNIRRETRTRGEGEKATTYEVWVYDEKQFDNKEYVEALSDKTEEIGLNGADTAEALALVENALTELIKLVYSKLFGIK